MEDKILAFFITLAVLVCVLLILAVFAMAGGWFSQSVCVIDVYTPTITVSPTGSDDNAIIQEAIDRVVDIPMRREEKIVHVFRFPWEEGFVFEINHHQVSVE